MQQSQETQFAVVTKNNVVQKVERSTINQPKIEFTGSKDGIRWYKDKPKKKAE